MRKTVGFLFLFFATGVLGAEPLGDGVAANEVDAQGKAFPSSISDSEPEISLPEIVTYVSAPVVEQRIVFSKEDIEKFHAEDLSAVVRQAGIQSLDYGAYGLESKPSIRGFTDETVRVVIDGLCMNNAQTGTFDFSSINVADVEKIEIVRGGFTEGTEDEGSVGGAIYITTKKHAFGRQFSSDTALKSFLNQNFPLDTVIQKIAYSAALSENSFLSVSAKGGFAKNSYIYKTSQNSFKERENSSVKDGNGDIRFTHWHNGSRITAASSVYYGDKETPGVEYSTNQGKQKDFNVNFTLSSFTPGLFGKMNLTSNLAYLRNDRKYEDNYGPSRHKINDFKGSVAVDFYRCGIFAQSAAVSFDLTHLNSTNSGIHFQPSGVLKETSKLYFNGFFSMTVPIAIKFCGKNLAFVPKIGFAAKFSKIEILLDGYRMVQFPNMDDLYWEGSGYHGNPDLKPEQGWGADLTFNLKNKILPSSVQFFSNFYEKKITWSGGTTQNVNSAFYFGIDFNAQKTFFDGILTLKAGGEYLYNELLDKSNKLTYKKRIMWTPDFTGTAQAIVDLKKFDFSVSAQYTGKRYKSNMNITFLEPYTLLNLNLNLKFWEKILLYFKADNILNERYQSVENYPMPGTSLTIGCKIKIENEKANLR